jgi:hypothetical protein
VYAISLTSPKIPASVGAVPPAVFTRWMCVTPLKTPGPSLETALSNSHGMASGLAVQRLLTAPPPFET